MKRSFLVLTALLFSLAPLYSQTAEAEMYEFVEAKKADAEKDYAKAMEWYLKAAEKGNSRAMNNIGFAYSRGAGVTKNETKALEWYLKAAAKGNEVSMENVGINYYYGQGTDVNYAKAMEWYKKAAEKGNSNAMFRVGEMYKEGVGVTQDFSQAYEWYLKAAEKGDADAQFAIGDLYRFGHLEGGWPKVIEWFQLAAENDHATATYLLGNFCYNGSVVQQNFDFAFQFYHRAAELGSVGGYNGLGNCYYNGYGVEKDPTEAAKYYQVAAENGDAAAQTQLGYLYLNGEGVPKDYQQALHWSSQAAEQGHVAALVNTGIIYGEGYGVPVDYTKAITYIEAAATLATGESQERYMQSVFKYAKKSAEAGNADGMCWLADCYALGYGVEQESDLALAWYRQAADKGYARAMGAVGAFYQDNNRDLKAALDWLKKAERAGDTTYSWRIADLEQDIKETNHIAQEEMQKARFAYWDDDYAEAIAWYRQAADKGNVKAMVEIGDMYMEGKGVTKSESKAREWYQKSVDAGYDGAADQLAEIKEKDRLRRLRNNSARYALIGTEWKYDGLTLRFDFSDTSQKVKMTSSDWSGIITGDYVFDGTEGKIRFTGDLQLYFIVSGSSLRFEVVDDLDFWDMAAIALGGEIVSSGSFWVKNDAGEKITYYNGTFRKQ